MSQSLRLFVKSPLPAGSSPLPADGVIEISADIFVIGRDKDCSLMIADTKVSRHHCRIEQTPEGKYRIIDAGSSNGTFVNPVRSVEANSVQRNNALDTTSNGVNGARITETVLTDGDVITVGDYQMTVNPATTDNKNTGGEPPPTEVMPKPQKRKPFRLFRKPKESPLLAILLLGGLALALVIWFITSQSSRSPLVDEMLRQPDQPKETRPPTNPAKAGEVPPDGGIEEEIPVIETQPEDLSEPQAPSEEERTRLAESEKAELEKLKLEIQKRQEAEAAARKQQSTASPTKLDARTSAKLMNDWLALKPKIADAVKKYQYNKAISLCNDFLKNPLVKDTQPEASALVYLDELQGEQALFNHVLQAVQPKSNPNGGLTRRKIKLASMEVWVNKADGSGFEGYVAGSEGSSYQRSWDNVPTDIIYDLIPKDEVNGRDRFYLAVFCANHGFNDQAEDILISYSEAYPDANNRVQSLVARLKNEPVPPGGFVVYQGQWVTPLEKAYLEKGYVKYNGRWMTYDQMMMAKGYVRFQDRWMTPSEKEYAEVRLRALEELKGRLAPKGIIDKPGADYEGLTWDKARTKETAHYKVTTDLSQDALNDICYVMECLYYEFKKIFRVTKDPPSKLEVWVFRTAQEYNANGGRPGTGGVFMGAAGRGRIMTFYQPGTTMTLLHEGTHQFVSLVAPVERIPIWINEGMATYYESSKFEGTTLKTNQVNRNRLGMIKQALQRGNYVRLKDFINTPQPNYAILHYAEGWSLIYFFVNWRQGQYADELEKYFDWLRKGSLQDGAQHIKAFEEIFKTRIDVLEAQWKEYILKLK